MTALLLAIAGVLGLMAGWTVMPLIAFAAVSVCVAGRAVTR